MCTAVLHLAVWVCSLVYPVPFHQVAHILQDLSQSESRATSHLLAEATSAVKSKEELCFSLLQVCVCGCVVCVCMWVWVYVWCVHHFCKDTSCQF